MWINRKEEASGFTLIEILVVLSIIGILLGLAVPQYQISVKRAREAVLKENLFIMRKLIDQYYQDKHRYPPSLQSLVEENYLKALPIDPVTGSNETWIEVREMPPADEYVPPENLGVIDVKSGSEARALDGSFYNTW
ncbi:MAG TPA: type II secretion system protein [Candidatus Saccharicenans sp.]|jgi:general secretion pathway protein G|nr:type II secretion system protein [Candidatus Saccharicenans sp.]HPB58834.1 type II secretion system protein [Candidatus Saccharicenans sp.]HQO75579.1 type II secretion system protein [Candidatus Saccharicenans sp.]HUM79208.1 type II secretion system protein [Candidatus Saccharicenans sp.]